MDRRNKCRSLTQFLDLLVKGDAVGVVPQQHHRRETKLLELAKCIRFFEQFKHGFPMVAPSPLSMICPSAAWSPNRTRTAVRYDFAFLDPLKHKRDEEPRKIHTSTKFYKKS